MRYQNRTNQTTEGDNDYKQGRCEKKLDEIIAEEASVEKPEATDVLDSDDLERVNGGLAAALHNYSHWKKKDDGEGGATPNGRGASGGW